ncbi:lysophospholipid acyltransferase family protein [Chitinophaga horti]|uniref:Lysophospholipid acyltransferase family protein n=1 Tax=Chitinophaga horti TaxID=2920382 RepID=A0ABY6J7M8_9BACT|nr:lysophospholipid acyltransferase family protein [Chitinophaga horti]UYQ95693.1 lysophospholipid acyltransferase family protein [Chitinophaga horti]
MTALLYYLALPVVYLISLLPFPLLYLLSDVFFGVLYYVVRYRRGVVMENLNNSFPEKSPAERARICRDFYRYFCDLFLETFKTLTISKEAMVKHCAFTPETVALFKRLHAEGKSVVLVMGHKGNWEWAGNTFSILCPQQLYVVYHPLRNKHFNGLMYNMRTRFGTKLIAMQDTFRDMVKNRNEISATALIADQSPRRENAQWVRFLNQDTAVFTGTERIAAKMNYQVVYVSVSREKRGYYTVTAEVLVEAPAKEAPGNITSLHTARLEADIINQPSTWLWSHRRWKHKKLTTTATA